MTLIERKLRHIVSEIFVVGCESSDLCADDSFIETGMIDSTGILELVEILEQEFGLKIDDEDLIPENLDSINRLVAFVERKTLHSSIPTVLQSLPHPSDAEARSVGATSPESD